MSRPWCLLVMVACLTTFSVFLVDFVEGSPPFLYFPRGGTALVAKRDENNIISVDSAVGILTARSAGLNDDKSSANQLPWITASNANVSCILFDGKNQAVSQISNLPRDDAMTKCLVFLCDVVILYLPDMTDDIDNYPRLVSLLVEAAKKRVDAGLGKARLVLVAPFATDDDEDSSRMDGLVQRQFADIVPSEWHSFDILPSHDAALIETHVGEILAEQKGRVCDIFPQEEENIHLFVKLLYQAYHSLDGDESIPPFKSQALQIASQPATATSESLPTPKVADDSSSARDGVDDDARQQEIVINCQTQLEALESKLQDVLLSDNEQQMPMLDFGPTADSLLNRTYMDLADFTVEFQQGVLVRVVTELHRLYREQLQMLRDYYGKRYERILEESEDEGDWTAAAEHFMQGFQVAAFAAVPSLCKPSEPLAAIANFDPTSALQGLITDMLEATQLKKDEQGLAMEGDDDESAEEQGRFHRVPRWLKKLAGRALVLGVNYIQGWLAWQGVKRAAIERDRSMPKFPLF